MVTRHNAEHFADSTDKQEKFEFEDRSTGKVKDPEFFDTPCPRDAISHNIDRLTKVCNDGRIWSPVIGGDSRPSIMIEVQLKLKIRNWKTPRKLRRRTGY